MSPRTHRFPTRIRVDPTHPGAASAVVGGAAVAFTAVWMTTLADSLPPVFADPPLWLGVLCVGTAVLVSWLVWEYSIRRSDAPLTARRGTKAGAVIGVVSYLTLAVVFELLAVLAWVVLDAGAVCRVGRTFFLALLFGFLSTYGIPVVLSVGGGAVLGWCNTRRTG